MKNLKKTLNTEPGEHPKPLDPPYKTVTDYNISNDILCFQSNI